MQMEFRRLTGLALGHQSWPSLGTTPADLATQTATMLRAHYNSDGKQIWPKKQYFQKAPEEVRIVDDAGRVVARYDIRDLISDTGCELVGNRFD
jgi:hypothetical protein